MKENIAFREGNNKPKYHDEVLKATALIYFKEALFNEQYEDCRKLVRLAKRFGARQEDVRQVIAESNRGVVIGPGKADNDLGGRLRFY
jgi:hypothetical protein